MGSQENKWPKKITVDKRIVRILSGSTYSNFPSAIRELITNGYDADAETVDIDVDISNEVITVTDNGKGMDESDFAFYLRIAGKSRKKDDTSTKSNRKIVGQFGVGFLSILPFCEKYLIETKKKGSDEIVYATILSTEYFDDNLKTLDVDAIPILGGSRYDKSRINDQFTRIRLVGFSKLTRAFFNGEYNIPNRRNTKTNYGPVELLKWELSEYLPLQYDGNEITGKILNELIDDKALIPFKVFVNQERLFRNLYAKTILEKSDDSVKIGDISFKYALLTDYKPIIPIEARYLMLRNLNVGVGERTTLGLGLDGKLYGKLAHITGEVFITSGLNELISVSRDKFNFSPDYEALKDFLRSKLAKYANDLDLLKSAEKILLAHQDNTRVSNINSLKKDNFQKEIDQLESKGFSVRQADADTDRNQISINQERKEIVLTAVSKANYDKLITFENVEYRLRVQSWDLDSPLPAVRLSQGVYEINESYSLFKEKNFDPYLKMHLILFNYLNSGQIDNRVYRHLVSDLSLITK